MILLRPVHFVVSDGPHRGRCAIADVVDHGVESVDLSVCKDPQELTWSIDAERMFDAAHPTNVTFDADGKEGTFHFANDCPIDRRERERQRAMEKYLERRARKRKDGIR